MIENVKFEVGAFLYYDEEEIDFVIKFDKIITRTDLILLVKEIKRITEWDE